MQLKDYINTLPKLDKSKDTLTSLTLSILQLEETLVEKTGETVTFRLRQLLDSAFSFIKEQKFEVNNEVHDLDLDYWKDNIGFYKSKNPDVNQDVFLYSIRNSLKFLFETKKDKKLQQAYVFDIVIKTFLFIDYLHLSINTILA